MPWRRWQADFYAVSDRVSGPVSAGLETLWERRWLRQAVWSAAIFVLFLALGLGEGRPIVGTVHQWARQAVLADLDPNRPGGQPDGFWRTASLEDMLGPAREVAGRLPWSQPTDEPPRDATLVHGGITGPGGASAPGGSGAPDSPGTDEAPAPGASPQSPDPAEEPVLVRFAQYPLIGEKVQVLREWGWQTPGGDAPTMLHEGLDYAAGLGDAVVAVADGQVIATGETQTAGAWLEIDHGHGLTTYYAQMSYLLVRVGDRIGAGQVLGHVGESREPGLTVAHVHFEVRKDGKAVEPAPFLPEAGGTQ